MPPLRVLHINAGNLYGGVESCLATLVREEKWAPGMHTSFAVCFEGRFSAELAALGRAPYLLGEVRLSRPHTIRRARAARRELLRQEPADASVCPPPGALRVRVPATVPPAGPTHWHGLWRHVGVLALAGPAKH